MVCVLTVFLICVSVFSLYLFFLSFLIIHECICMPFAVKELMMD